MKIEKCKSKKCERQAVLRGLCLSHYNSLRRALKIQNASWVHAEKSGLCNPKAIYREVRSEFRIAIEKSLKENPDSKAE